MFKGVRIAIGLHTGEGKYVKDPATGWVSYVGVPLLFLEKLGKTAWGGQILASEEACQQAQSHPEVAKMIAVTPRVTQVSVEIEQSTGTFWLLCCDSLG